MVGGVTSFTVTVKVAVDVPTALVAVAVTVVVPTAKLLPGAILYVIVDAGIPVVSVAVNATGDAHNPGVLFTVILAGATTTGATPVTVTVNVHSAKLPEASVAR